MRARKSIQMFACSVCARTHARAFFSGGAGGADKSQHRQYFEQAVMQINADHTVMPNTTLISDCDVASHASGPTVTGFKHFANPAVVVGVSTNTYGTEFYTRVARDFSKAVIDLGDSPMLPDGTVGACVHVRACGCPPES